MKKYIIAAALSLSAVATFSQNISTSELQQYRVPDWNHIEGEVTDPASKFYYPILMGRYTANDSTLTEDDFYYLYYGFSTQPGYKPLSEPQYADSLRWAFINETEATEQTFRRVIHFCQQILAERPFSMRDLNALAFAYQMLGEEENASNALYKVAMITSTIRSSGNGLHEKFRWYIIFNNDAEDLLSLMGAQQTKAMIVSRTTKFISVSNMPEQRYKGYYFDISEIYRRKPEYLEKEKKKRKFELNPQYNPKSKLYRLPQ